jgi:predicted transcriptional regulator
MTIKKTLATLLVTTIISAGAWQPAMAGCASSRDVRQLDISTQGYVTASTTTITGMIQLMQQQIVAAVQAMAAGTAQQKNMEIAGEQANHEVTDAKKALADKQKQEEEKVRDIAKIEQEAIEKYAPTVEECASITVKMVQEYNIVKPIEETRAVLTSDAQIQAKGPSEGATRYKNSFYAEQSAAYESGGEKAARYSTSRDVARMECQSAECFNDAIKNMARRALVISTADRAPKFSTALHAIGYTALRQGWEARRASNRLKIDGILPNMMTSLDRYALALTLYKSNFLDGEKRLNLDFPNASKIGLSNYEMDIAAWKAISGGGQSGIAAITKNETQTERVNSDRKMMQQASEKAETAIREFEPLLQAIASDAAPSVPTGALQKTTGTP